MGRDQGSGIGDQAIAEWQDATACPPDRPSLESMSATTRNLHNAIDAHARRTGIPYLHPDEPTVQLDLLGSKNVIAWQERKAAFLFASEGCWSELPHLYARYGTTATAELISRIKALEHASTALVCDSGMQATALAFDALMEPFDYAQGTPGSHAVLMRQVYNKTRSYLEWMAARIGGSVTIVDDGDMGALRNAIKPETRFVFAETFTNPLVRAQDFEALKQVMEPARAIAPALRFVLDGFSWQPARIAHRRARHHDRLTLGLQDAAPAERRRHRACQRHQVARRQRSRYVGLHRHQRHAVRQRRDGLDGDAWRHPRLAPCLGGRRGVRGRGGFACSPLRGGITGGRLSRHAPEGQRGISPLTPPASGSRRHRTRLCASRVDAVVPHPGRG